MDRKLHVPLGLDPTVIADRPRTLVTPTQLPTGEPAAIAPAAAPLGKRGTFSEYVMRPLDYQEPAFFGAPKPLPPISGKPLYVASSLVPSTRSFRRPASKRDSLEVRNAERRSADAERLRDETPKVQINYRKALEPKVMLPYVSRPGQTPRKIEIERRKRVYSMQRVDQLIVDELDMLKAAGLIGSNPMTEFEAIRNETHTAAPMASPSRAAASPAAASQIDSQSRPASSRGPLPALSADATSGETAQPVAAVQSAQAGFTTEFISSQPSATPATTDFSHILPLHIFDDSEFDSRTVDDWLDMSVVLDDPTPEAFARIERLPRKRGLSRPDAPDIRYAVVPLPARAFNGFEWSDCVVVAYDDTNGKWKVKWRSFDGWLLDRKTDDDAQIAFDADDETLRADYDRPMADPRDVSEKEAWLDRVSIMFLAEDPAVFSHRVSKAYLDRYQVALKLRISFYVDCMPTEEVAAHISPAQIKRIMDIAGVDSRQFKRLQGSPAIAALVKEYSLDYARTMNYLVFQSEVSGPLGRSNYPSIELPLPDPPAHVPVFGKAQLPQYDFAGCAKAFGFASFLTKVEVIRTLAKVRIECDRLAGTNLFATSITKTVKIDEFEQLQGQALQNVKGSLKDGWINVLKNIIRSGFKDVGKGWYNMQESNLEVYKISKLRKFMTAVNFVMQDSLRFLVLNSLQEYTRMIRAITSQKVTINATSDVKVVDPGAKEPRKPLFMIDLVFKAGRLQYNIDPVVFEGTLMAIFEKAISTPENLPQLEPLVLDQMFWAAKPTLQTVHSKEPAVNRLRASLQQAIRDGLAPLEAYLGQFEKHLKLLNLDIQQFAAQYESENRSVDEMETDIVKHTTEWETLDKDIPNHISLGLFWVNCDSLRSAMRKDLSKVILELLSKRTARLATQISQSFSQVQTRLKERPTKIEELIELREYIKTVPETCRALQQRLQEMLHNYEVLEKHRFECSNEDVRARWTAFGWPQRIDEMLVATEAALAVDEGTFARSLATDQEVFKDRIHTLTTLISDFSKHSDLSRIQEIVAEVNKITNELKDAQALTTLFNSRERLFNLEPTKYEEVSQLARDFEPYKSLWLTCSDWMRWKDQWMLGSFLELNAEDVERNLMNAWRTVFKSFKFFKNTPGCLAVATQVKEEMEEFKPYLPLIQALRNPGMRDRHWDRLSEELSMSLHPDASFTLTDLLKMKLLDRVDTITKVCDVAGKEYSIENALDKMDAEWKAIQLEIIAYKDTGTFIMKASEEVTRLLDDHIVMTQSMSFSPFKKPFADRINTWESKLRTVQEVLESWMTCQRSWLYLEPIFGSDDIVTQLPVESKRFTTMDRTWRRIMGQAKQKPGVIECCGDYKLLDSFRECNKLLELVSKGLSAYLESKRIAFPRFFFLSDDELLQILSQTKDPTAVQPHLRKCFENVASLEFAADKKILAMYSAEGERIDCSEPFYPKGPVEEWLLHVEDQMRQSVRKTIREAIAAYPNRQRTSWVLEWPGQAVLAGSQTYWTAEVTEALKTGVAGLKGLYVRLLAQLQGLVGLVRGELAFLNRLVLGDLIVIDVHSRDVVKKLVDSNISSDNDFEWISQLRYYWEEDHLRIKIVNANFKYGYEYLGNTGRLVITPLTDRCYLTLTGAMHLGMGGAPAGPAGTGKCWGRGTRLVMLDGTTKAVEEIREGDVLMGPDSKPRTVRPGSITRGTEAMYRVTATGNARISWTCNGPHILVLQLNAKPTVVAAGGRFFVKTWTTRPGTSAVSQIPCADLVGGAFATRNDAEAFIDELVRTEWQPLVFECTVVDYLAIKDESLRRSLAMFQPPLIEWPSPAVSLAERISEMRGGEASLAMVAQIAWAIGVWLALSTGSGRVETCEQVHSEFERIAAMLGEGVAGKHGSAFSVLLGSYWLAQATHIPGELMTECPTVRRALLAGLVDYSGSIGKDGGCTITSASTGIMTDAASLARGLGLVVGKSNEHASIAVCGAGLTAVAEHIVTDDKRRAVAELASSACGTDPCFGFTIECVGVEDYFGFSLDGHDGRCLLEDYTVTHNTETTKDLAKALAKQCVVFNCSDQLDYLAMAKFFKGLAASGAWACFDEFNRIDIEVLSVIAQQIVTIQKACAAGQTRFMFEGVDLPLDASNAIFITMNPGYAGRTELPDNLKALFRPVAMMIPNYAMIAEISLFSFGFSNAKVLAEKMVATFKLSSEQLSSQDHYDFGMRAVKTVISSAGNLKREQPNAGEDFILLRALCDCNLPKFLAEDVPLFNGIISDLFPGVEQPKIDYGELLKSLHSTCEKMGLQPQESFIAKCIQLYETTVVRHGLMLVGPTGGGKTSCLRVLSRSLSAIEGVKAPNGKTIQKVRVHVLNPKSITMGQLYGEFDQQTHEWTDGILSCLMREGVEDTTPDKKWYVFDGPVDAVWVESMNTLLDDNKKLCLSSGEIIKMATTQTMMFEVQDLAFASPATVSRCGMIYVEPGALGISPLVKSWLKMQGVSLGDKLYPVFVAVLQPMLDHYLDASLEFVRKSIREAVPTTNGNLVASLLRIMDSLLKPLAQPGGEKSPIEANDLKVVVEPQFLFALVWSVGATGDTEGRKKFDTWLRGQFGAKPPAIHMPHEGSVYDVMFDVDKKDWINWMDMLNEGEAQGGGSKGGSDVIVQTMDTVRNTFLIDILLKNGYHVLCTGPTGTGKSVTIQEKLMRGLDPNWTPITINFSARTSANQTQDLIDSKLEKRRKGVFGPPVGKRFILFIDDLNMPQLDICNAQPPIELLRQWMDCQGWYDRKNIGKFMEIVDISFICAMGPPGGGRNPVTSRFLRHFNLLSFVEMENASLQRIFTTILGSFLSKFPPEITKSTNALVEASIIIYNTIRSELLPTPAKSHYTFNLRDLAKVVQGILSADLKTVNVETDIVRLWVHECQRVFQDRLVDNTDKTWFKNLVMNTMTDKLDLSWGEVVLSEPLLYGDYMTPGADPKIYTEVKDLRRLVKLAEEYLDDYNSTSTSPMKLVMFLDAIEHVSRICRIIRQPGGHALLLGVGGSGRQSLSRLATFMEEFDQFQIEISKNYGQTEWRDDLKKVLFASGLDGKPTVFLYTDTQIVSEACLEDVNNILNGGDVPNIYTGEEMDRILNTMRPIATEQAIPGTRENLFALYIQRIRANLHMIICMSPIGDAFRNRLRMFPSLVNCCTIDWFSTWPEDALRSVAANSISEISDLGSEEVIDGIVNLCVFMHESVRERCISYRTELNRNNYVTPKSYLELLGLYKRLLEKKRNELLALRKRTATGLEKLLNATKEVEILQEELEAMQPMLMQTSQETEYAMKKIAVDKIKAEEIKENVVKEELASSKKAEETKAIADDAKRDLDEALPALDAAVESLNSLSKNDIIEVRSMQRPPEGVKLVIEAICIMKGIKPKKVDGDKPGKKIDDYWEPGRALLADPQKFLDSLMNFDKDNIAESTVQRIKPYIDSPEFQVSVISRVSKAATSMCQWVRAMEKYYWVSRSVAPKRARLQEAQESLDITLKALAELKKKMREAEVNIKEMEKRYSESVAKKEELSRKVEECNVKLSRAGKLISGLGGEKQRWALAVDQFDMKINNIIGDILLSSGAIAYLGPFTAEYRSLLMREWIGSVLQLKIPHSENTSLWDSLGDNVKLREWEISGLPKDSLSRDNAIIVHNSRRWPLLIDPQGQANKWIRNMEKEHGLDIIKLTDRDFLRTLENAIRFGKSVLLENVGEKLDPALEPVLLRQTFKQGGNTVIKVGDSILPYHDDFKFYITTKLPNPHYSPETSATATLVNFTLAPSGLEDQLLAIVVANERPDLEEAKNQLTVNNAQMKRELKEIEDKILYLLSSVQGSPVDDERLIETLGASKETSEEIQQKVAAAEQTEREIDTTRNKYVPVAVRTRILFFCITELANIDPMYQYSLNWFMNLFVSAISHSEKSDDIDQRVANINEYFTFSLFTNVCRSLFEKHKLLFSFLLTIRILMNDDKVDMDEWRFLLTGGGAPDSKLQNPAPDWLSVQSWAEILGLATLPAFTGFDADFVDFVQFYMAIFDSSQPHREPLPGKWQSELDGFQKLLVLRCLRADRVTSGIQDFVAAQLGERFIEPQTSDLSALFKESSPITPLIFVLSPGADPANSLYKFAEEMRMSKKLSSVSLGQGQGPRAEALMKEGMERGMWILLQNCHLSPSWMPSLDRIIDSITMDKVHRDFRLWLTSMPTPKFPVTILQNGVKTTLEPPNGIKANLMRNYSTFSEDFLSQCLKPNEWKKLLFSLCFFHAVIQERRKFGPLGWNIPYEFTDGDLRICIRQLKMFLEEYDEVPYKVLKYTVGEINYGGRVTDDWDRRLIMNILEDYYTPRVLEDTYRFSTSEVYRSIPAESYNAYKAYIKSLPIDETTEIFSMHDNANITFAQKQTYTLFDTLLALMPKSSKSSSGKTRDEQLSDIATMIQSKIPKPFPMEYVMKKFPIEYKESMSTVLVQEVIRYNKLLSAIHSTIVEMIKALKGLVVLSESLETLCNSMYINQVPALWAAKAYPSLKTLASWVVDLVLRCEFIQKWIDQGIPNVFWISGFFFPQAFLTGTLQNYARKYVVSIDLLSFEFKVMDSKWEDIRGKPSDGCYIRGLFLEGARWDGIKKFLAESRPKELYTEMNVIWLLPKPNRKRPDTGFYECPVYKTLTRAGTLSTTGHSTNYVLTIELPSDLPQSHWIKRGVALITGLAW
nr:Dynein heavy chain 1, axonemal [Polyrhizophydium stewartii]